MRKVESTQCELGGTFIRDIVINPKSRDDIPALLLGLQHLYLDVEKREKIFQLLDAQVNPKARKDTGRPGMELWRILVLAALKQGLQCDYDRIVELANEHATLRQMLGHGLMAYTYEYQTVVDNIRLLTPELLAEIGQLVTESGHEVARKKPGETLRGRADSFCVETSVHFPTDTNLLWDAMRCAVRTAASLAESLDLRGWRQFKHITGRIKQRFNRVRTSKQIKRSPQQVTEYLSECQQYLKRAEHTLKQADEQLLSPVQRAQAIELKDYIQHAHRQIDQLTRRVINGEKIPHEEKVFSIFQPHTRWITKGKAGISQELGVPVCVVEDQYRFILHHRVMWDGSDVDHAVPLITEARQRFPDLRLCSFDRGFHSPANQQVLSEQLDNCALPKKGYRSAAVVAHESQPWFQAARQKHPGIEAAINHLEHCGLDRVRDHGKRGFARAVALSVLAANLKRLGRLVRDQQRKKLARQQRLRAA
ncbi:MAG: ISNCY family transposase [Gemmatimonadota bacterium]|nr:ISNCY family transposase [Gemmatimonadota bacterium]